jgi:hypothetical protein
VTNTLYFRRGKAMLGRIRYCERARRRLNSTHMPRR